MFNFSFDVFEISFIYAAFLSFRRFFLFNFKFKSTCFRRRSDSHWTILSEKLFLCNQIYRLFHAFSFLIILSDYLLCDMKHITHITVSFSDTRKSCKQDSPSAAGNFSDIIPLHRSALLPGRLYFLCTFMYVIGTLQSNLL